MGYYADRLSGERLRECYAIAPARVSQYLEAEIRHVMSRIEAGTTVLELGCGYGRVATRLAEVAGRVIGIDTATGSLDLAQEHAGPSSRCEFLEMNARELFFPDDSFDAVICVQNGICAFGEDPLRLIREAARVTRPSGRVLFSSYAERFWQHRLAWFELQAARGLVGEIDIDSTRDGVIVCKDGFRSGTMRSADFERLCREVGLAATITEVDGSSLFCEIHLPDAEAAAGSGPG